MNLKNHTLIELTKKVEDLNSQLTNLKREVAANTQATGKNTIAVEGITSGLKELARQTGEWRDEDRKHHEEEGKLNKEKIGLMKGLKCLFEANPENGIKRTC